MRFLDSIFLKNKFRKDVSWNTLTFGIMVISGIALNLLILRIYGVEILGAFNQVYAVYIFFSQLAAFGLYASVLKYISEHSKDRSECSDILTSAIFLYLGMGSLTVFIYYVLSPFLGELLNSPLVARGLMFSLLGLWCFSLNKILLAFLNGLRLMKAYALFNAFRYLMLPLSLVFLIILGLPGYVAPLVFTITEGALLIGLLIFIFFFRPFPITPISQCKKWFKAHLLFGAKSLIGGTATEMNSRIDVFMLGIFSADKIVGIYSLAAIFAEGLAQIPVIFRVNYNPLLTQFVAQRRLKELCLNIRYFLRKWNPFSLTVVFLAALSLFLSVWLIGANHEFSISFEVFAILIIGIAIWSGYAVFWELPSQAGFPGRQTSLIMFTVLSNISLNYLLIPFWGIYGAAIATSLSFILSIFYLKLIVRKILDIAV